MNSMCVNGFEFKLLSYIAKERKEGLNVWISIYNYNSKTGQRCKQYGSPQDLHLNNYQNTYYIEIYKTFRDFCESINQKQKKATIWCIIKKQQSDV